jgi:uncharacterized protein
MNPNLVLPVGTRIVTRIEVKTDSARALRPVGAVAEIIAVPADALHSYRVRFPDGAQASVRRREFSIWSQYRDETAGSPDPLIDHELFAQHIIYRCVVGSRAYGLDGPGSDTDRRGIYLPPADLHWSLYGVPEQLENVDSQECYWELQKFLDLALRANPNVLECLWTPLVERTTPLADDLLRMREAFLSKLVYQTYNGYVRAGSRSGTRGGRLGARGTRPGARTTRAIRPGPPRLSRNRYFYRDIDTAPRLPR